VNQDTEQVALYHRSPEAIRAETFTHRMRGLDEQEVREYLALIADQVAAAESCRAELAADNERLRAELEEQRDAAQDEGEISTRAVLLFSQAQQIADQLVEEAVVHARDLMTSARNQQREILEEAHRAAEVAAREASRASGQDLVSAATDTLVYSEPVPEIEYVRTFARVAQVQLRSVLDALAEQVDKLGEVPEPGKGTGSRVIEAAVRTNHREWQVESLLTTRRPDEPSR
jgi:cell division initiation protein